MSRKDEILRLDNQLCFPFYAVSRLITRAYQPLLAELNLTYPQYLVLLVLWESDGQTVNDIAERLVLNTNTLTPLLKRLEKQDLISRRRDSDDERKVIVRLTETGRGLKNRAMRVPETLAAKLTVPQEDLLALKSRIDSVLSGLRSAISEAE